MKKLLFSLLLFAAPIAFGQEDCADGIDNDADGLIDLNDPDCECSGFGLTTTPSSLIPNPSFEDYSCCPTAVSMLYCADSWVQASAATSDYLNTCMGFTSLIPFDDPALPPPGGGDGYAGFHNSNTYKEYVGACLTGPMLAGTCYQLDLWIAHSTGLTDINLTLYGSDDCADMPWAGFACPIGSGGWQVLDAEFLSVAPAPGGAWSNVVFNFTPAVDIAVIALGGSCTPTAGTSYMFIDELILAACTAFGGGGITESGNWCDGDLLLTADIDTFGGTWQWYQDSIAIVGETGPTLDVMGSGPGSYSAVYTIGADCEVINYTLTIPDSPVADFTFDEACYGVAVPFTDASTMSGGGSIVSWDWDFGDGNTSVLQNPSNTFASPGTYTVSLTVTSDLGCTHTLTQDIIIHPDPTPDFTVSDVCVGEPSAFVDASSGGTILTWAWDFGDGGTSALEDPSYTYSAAGTYNVTLTISTDLGCVTSVTLPTNVTAEPTAAFTTSNVCLDTDASFVDGSTVGVGTITSWAWDFGDGGTSSDEDPIHTYTTPGTYNVELIVNAGAVTCADTVEQTITIYPMPDPDFSTSNVCLGDATTFTDLSSVPAPDAIASWEWDFGDAMSSALESPSHVYTTFGTYDVELTVTTTNGCQSVVTIPITVYDLPTVHFTSTTECENTVPTTFTDFSSAASGGSITSWSWDFGDGSTSTDSNPTHLYSSAGVYNTTLTVVTDQGCTNTINYTVQVHYNPTVAFSANETVICNPGCIIFTSTSTTPGGGSVVDWQWDFESGVGSGEVFTHCFQNPDGSDHYYDVKLTVTNDNGCTDSMTIDDYIYVVPTPIAAFGFNPQILTTEESVVQFNNSSLWSDSYVWTFGDGSPTSSDENPSHEYPDVAGEYTIELEAYSIDKLCKDSLSKLIIVEEVLIFYVPNVFTPDGDQYNETFQPHFFSGFDPYNFHMTIFNRWGEIVFESYDAKKGWDGTYGSRGLAEDGVYIWQIEYKEIDSEDIHKQRGHVTILK